MTKTLLFILLLISSTVLAQIGQTARIELDLKDTDSEDFSVYSADTLGIIMVQKGGNFTETITHITRLDTSLNKVWQGYISLERGLASAFIRVSGDRMFMIFRTQVGSSPDFKIVSIKIADGRYSVYTVKNFIPMSITDFQVYKNSAFIGGYYNYRPLVIHFDFETQKSRVMPALMNEVGELNQIQINPTDETVDLLINAKNLEKKKCLWIKTYDLEGNLLRNTIIEPERRKQFIFGRSIKTDSTHQTIVGVYGRFTDYSRGIFVCDVNPYGEYKTKYYNYGDLENFFGYMKQKKQKRIKERIERRKLRGRKIKFNYRFLVDELVPFGDQLIMLGEAFYPHYSYRPRSYGFIPSSAYYTYNATRNDLIFDGFDYTHAVVIAFDKEGNRIWDNSFAINGIRSMQLDQFVRMGRYGDKMILLYTLENEVRSKVIRENTMIEKSQDRPKSRRQKRGDIETKTSKLDYWYGGNYFVYGIQFLRNPYDGESRRKVFYINKLSLK